MFFQSHAVVSVFAFTVLLNVFYFDPTQSRETLIQFDKCYDCIISDCHQTGKHRCFLGLNNYTYCYYCENDSKLGDQQFYTKSDCEAKCENKKKWRFVLRVRDEKPPEFVECGEVDHMFYDSCKKVLFKLQP
jgi:hypothetical protein